MPATYRDDEKMMKPFDMGLFLRLLSYVAPYRLHVVAAVCLMFVVSGATMLVPLLTRMIIDQYIMSGDVRGLRLIILVLAGVFAVGWLASYWRTFIMSWIGQRVMLEIRRQIFSHLQRLTFAYYDKIPAGKIITRLTSDVDSLNELLSGGIVNVISDSVVLVGIIIIMLLLHLKLALVSFATLPLMIYMVTSFRQRIFESQREVRARVANVNASLQENLSGVRVTQAFCREDENLRRFDVVNRESLNAGMNAMRVFAWFWPGIEMAWTMGTIVVLWFGGRWMLAGELTVGDMVAFLGYTGQFFGPLRNLSQVFRMVQMAMAGAERIFGLLDTPPTVTDAPDAYALPAVKGRVEFKNVCFAYEKDEGYVLKGINLKVDPGEMVALVGHTGAGKTSIINLLCRFYDVTMGQVLIDGHDISKVTLKSLRSQIGLVLQEPFLFSGTIKENLLYGKPDASDEEIVEAARTVNAHAFIEKLEQGYDTPVQERGSKLSLGQKQLLSFARALLSDPRILILDEATASIDTQTEQLIQAAANRLLAGRTAFVIAHRLSTIRRADKIMVIENGEIAEVGTHDELLRHGGIYSELHAVQFKYAL